MKICIRSRLVDGPPIFESPWECNHLTLDNLPREGEQIVVSDNRDAIPPQEHALPATRCFRVLTVERYYDSPGDIEGDEVHLFCVEFPPGRRPAEGYSKLDDEDDDDNDPFHVADYNDPAVTQGEGKMIEHLMKRVIATWGVRDAERKRKRFLVFRGVGNELLHVRKESEIFGAAIIATTADGETVKRPPLLKVYVGTGSSHREAVGVHPDDAAEVLEFFPDACRFDDLLDGEEIPVGEAPPSPDVKGAAESAAGPSKATG